VADSSSGLNRQTAPRAGMLYPIEGDRWILTVAGVGRDYPPTDEAGFLEFTRSFVARFCMVEMLNHSHPSTATDVQKITTNDYPDGQRAL